jgi:hypothetical protein
MAHNTTHDRLVAALLATGERVIFNARTSRYTVITRKGGEEGYYFIGKAGALRAGRTISKSRPVVAAFRAQLLAKDEIAS